MNRAEFKLGQNKMIKLEKNFKYFISCISYVMTKQNKNNLLLFFNENLF